MNSYQKSLIDLASKLLDEARREDFEGSTVAEIVADLRTLVESPSNEPPQHIAKGTVVLIRTTNGGEMIVTLAHDYEPTYPVTLERSYGGSFVVMPCRLKSIEPINRI